MEKLSYRDSHINKGLDYDETFTKLPHRAVLWKLEQQLLKRLVKELFPMKRPTHLDFACGTGRILAHLESVTESQVGIDVSPSMLEVAKNNNPSATIIESDLTRENPLDSK